MDRPAVRGDRRRACRPGPAVAFLVPCDSVSMPPTSSLPTALTPDSVRLLAERSVARDSASAFQALLAASAHAVRTARATVLEAEGAALSLRQRETVAAVAADLEAAADALCAGISDQARCLERRRPADRVRALRPSPGWLPRLRERAAERAQGAPAPTWLAAAAAAVEALGQSAEHVAVLADGQPPRSSSAALGRLVAERLRAGRDRVLADVARLVD